MFTAKGQIKIIAKNGGVTGCMLTGSPLPLCVSSTPLVSATEGGSCTYVKRCGNKWERVGDNKYLMYVVNYVKACNSVLYSGWGYRKASIQNLGRGLCVLPPLGLEVSFDGSCQFSSECLSAMQFGESTRAASC